MKSKLVILILLLLLGILACGGTTPAPAPNGDAVQEKATATATATFTPEPATNGDDEEAPAPAASDIVPDEEIEGCTQLLTPVDGTELPAAGPVTFSWQPVDGAALYQVYFIFPTEVDLTFELEETSITRFVEAFSMHPAYHQGGEHQWNVSALNADGEMICSSDFFTFSKPDSASAPEEKQQGDSGGGQPPPNGTVIPD